MTANVRPDIVGTNSAGWGGDRDLSGSFYKADKASNDANMGTNQGAVWKRSFSASRSNGIFGKSSTNQTNALRLLAIVKTKP